MNLLFLVVLSFCQSGLLLHIYAREFFKNRQITLTNNVFCSESVALRFLRNLTKEKDFIASSKLIPRDGDGYRVDFTALNKNRLGVFIDVDCASSKALIDKLSEDFFFNDTFVYLLETERFNETIELLGRVNLAWDSDVTLRFGGESYDVFKVNYESPLEISRWQDGSARVERRNCKGAPIKGSMALLNLTLSKKELHEKMLDYLYEPEKDLLSRVGYALMNIIKEMFNFTLDLTVTDNFGYLNETTGRFSRGSMFEALQDRAVDFTVALSTYISSRMTVANYAPQGSPFRTCFIFKHPKLLAEHTAFAKPFSLPLWVLVMAFIVTFGVAFRIVRQVRVKDRPSGETSLAGSLVLMIGVMSQQGLSTSSLRLPNRILAIFAVFVSLVIYVHYGAAVVRFLLSSTPRSLNNVDKLLASPLELYAEDVKYQRFLFLSNLSTDATKTFYKAILREPKGRDRFIGLDDGMDRVRRGKFALYASDINMYAVIDKTFTETEKCELAEVTTYSSGIGHASRKQSPFREILFRGAVRSKECGLESRERSRWYASKPTCHGLTTMAVSFEATLVAQLILTAGFVLSGVILLVEIRVKNMATRRKTIRRTNFVDG